MTNNIFTSFEEIEYLIRGLVPPIVYKYRSWKDNNHKDLLINSKIWFSHPFELNDPLDVRPPYKYDYSEMNYPIFLEKMRSSVNNIKPEITDERDKKVYCQNYLERVIKHNPEAYFDQNRLHYQTTEFHYNQYGIFSTCTNSLNTHMWKAYSDEGKGYCIGFDTVNLIKELHCSCKVVNYSNEPIPYSFTNNYRNDDYLFRKQEKWSNEEEFRLLTLGIGVLYNRLRTFSSQTAKQVLVGYNMAKADEENIVNIVNERYKDIPVFKVVSKSNNINLNLEKVKIG